APGTFSVLDAETGELKFSKVIANTEAVWAITIGPDKNVYFAGTSDGKLYRYVPELKEVQDLGANPSAAWVWDIEATDDGKIYGATYPGAGVFEYDINTGKFKNFGSVTDQDYARGLAVDGDYIYVGIGTTKHLYKINRHTGEKEELLIEGHSGENGFIQDVWVVNGKLLVAVTTINMIVVDPETMEIEGSFAFSNMISEPDPNHPNMIYYKNGTHLFKYDLNTNVETLLEGIPILPDTPRVKDMAWITLSTGETVLSFITQYGEYMLFNPETNELNFVALDLAATAVAIQSLETGPDGKLYMGGYQRGMSVYNPFSNEIEVNISSFAQPEGIGFLNDKVYYGTYVGAIMYSYDPNQPVDLNSNPQLEYDIKDEQDRPFAITSGDNKLFVGTIPDYGVLGGVLAIYDEDTGEWFQQRNVVQDQSIISLAYHDGKLFGGTSVWGGLGIDPKAEEAKIFVWDVEKGEKITEFTPQIPGIDVTPRMIGDLSIGPDGYLWGAVEGTIFKMDPETYEVVDSKVIRPSLYNSSKWFPYRLQWGPDGMLYTTLSRSLIAIDPETLDYKVLVEDFMNSMTVGVDGSIYYAIGSELHKIGVPETDATLKSITIDGEALEGFQPGATRYTLYTNQTENIVAEATQAGTTVEIVHSTDKTEIKVTGTDGKSTLTYTILWTDEPTEPEEPGKPDKPGKPEKPGKPDKPGKPNNPGNH
ncbi:WD40 repeat domain-containing protein, partial [Bacillus sp. JJ1521]